MSIYLILVTSFGAFIHSFQILQQQTATLSRFSSKHRQQQQQRSPRNHFHDVHSVVDPTLGPETNQPPTDTTSSSSSSSSSIYSLPALYDLAFGYRDYDEEVEFLLSKHMELVGSTVPPTRILEIAAGPARHSITALLSPLFDSESDDKNDPGDDDDHDEIPTVYCIDTSSEMAAYARQVLDDEIDQYEDMIPYKDKIQQKFRYQIADMRNFTLPEQQFNDHSIIVETVWILLGSLQHMLTNTDVIDCFKCIANVIPESSGTIFVELPHPRESTFNLMECTRNGWKVPLVQQQAPDDDDDDEPANFLYDNDDDDDQADDDDDGDDDDTDGGVLSIVWGDDGDAFDPITQVRQFSISFEVSGLDDRELDDNGILNNMKDDVGTSLQQVVPMRLFTAQEIDALARCAGLKVVAMYGALEPGVDVNDEEASYRLVCALQKQSR